MSTLYVMVGIPASGKSTKAAELVKKGAMLISSDKIRQKLFGDENTHFTDTWLQEMGYDGPQEIRAKEIFANSKVFDLVYRQSSERLMEGIDVIVDATSCSRKARKSILDNIMNADKRVCIVMAVPFETCCLRNRMRERVVPDSAMERIAGNFEFPSKDEGFEEIVYYDDKNDIDYGEALIFKTVNANKPEEAEL